MTVGSENSFSLIQFVVFVMGCLLIIGLFIFGALKFKQEVIDRDNDKNKSYNKPQKKPLQKVK